MNLSLFFKTTGLINPLKFLLLDINLKKFDSVGLGLTDDPVGLEVTDDPLGLGLTDDPVGLGLTDDPVGLGVTDDPLGLGVTDDPLGLGVTDDPLGILNKLFFVNCCFLTTFVIVLFRPLSVIGSLVLK